MNKLLLCLVLSVITISAFSQAANNTCATATNLGTIGGDCTSTIGDLYLANQTNPTASCGNRYDVWYRFTMPTASTNAVIKVTLLGNTALDQNNNTYIELFNTNNCTINGTATGGCNLVNTPRAYALTAGSTYYFRVNTSVNPNGSSTGYLFSVCVTSNDNCATATTISTSTPSFSGSVFGSSNSGIAVGAPCTGNADDDVWFKFNASSTTIANILVTGTLVTAGGVRIQAFSGTCGGTLTSIGCSSTGTLALSSLTAGALYYVRVYSNGASYPTAANSLFSIAITPIEGTVGAGRMNEVFHQSIISPPSLLDDPWEITYGSDGFLWVTEARGYKVQRLDPATGVGTTVLDLSDGSTFTPAAYKRTFTSSQNPWPQGGMMGLALHPEFNTNPLKKFVYIAYVHDYVGNNPTLPSGEQVAGRFFRTWVVKFTFDGTSLTTPEKLCDTIRGSNDHNSGRMIVAPVNNVNYLFYAVGDMGGGQFDNEFKVNKAQITSSVEGKILRFNLESDNDVASPGPTNFNNWAPNDNPFNGANQSFVWSTGMRNNQGFAYAKINGIERLYGTSHGPMSDDELNIIERGKNYGHPIVVGYNDGNYNNAKAGWPSSSLPLISTEAANVSAINTALADSYRDPIYSFYDTAAGSTGIVNSVQYIYNNINNSRYANGPWASEAPSGADIYTRSLIPGWKNSIMVASLKKGRVLRVRLNAAGTAVVKSGPEDTVSYWGSVNRYRDLTYSPDGKDLFVVMDKSSSSSGPSATNPVVPGCGGCLQKYTFLGYSVNTGAGNRSTIPNFIPVAAGLNNQCEDGNTVTINTASLNNNVWVPITDTNSNIIGEIYAQGRNLGTVTATVYETSTIRTVGSKKYLGRNITITPQNQPGGTVSIRLYITKAEYDALRLSPGSGISAITDLRILKNNDACGTSIASPTTLVTPTIAEAFGTDGYVLQANITSFSTFYFGSQLITLPVNLLTFTGELKGDATLLNWETASELNTTHFEIERSTDGTNFTKIGSVNAAVNSNTALKYNYTDNEVTTLATTIVYYRLKIVDIDNSYSYSNTITVSLPLISGNITVLPNPVAGQAKVLVAATANDDAFWSLVDNAGRTVMQGKQDLKKGNNQFNINMTKLAQGFYILKIKGAVVNSQLKVQKL